MTRLLLFAVLLAGCVAPAAAVTPPTSAPTETPVPTFTPIVLTPRPFVCASTDLCYPRGFLSAKVIDQYEPADSGPSIVRLHFYDAFGIFLAGHNGGTAMGALFGWQAGDDVIVYGEHYTVFGSTEQIACVPFVPPPPAKVYLITSANTESCASGQHVNLVVMAR